MSDQSDDQQLSIAERIRRIDADLLDRAIKAAGPRDWPNDFPAENGRYCNLCLECRETFIGHKRRVVCRVCAFDID